MMMRGIRGGARRVALDGTQTPGVDGVTKAMDEHNLEASLQALHRKLHQRSYRPQPGRRVEMREEDGTMRYGHEAMGTRQQWMVLLGMLVVLLGTSVVPGHVRGGGHGGGHGHHCTPLSVCTVAILVLSMVVTTPCS
jgi:hypothetical protein